ncbi:MAG: OsmC family protein [Ferruginibacter sp.]
MEWTKLTVTHTNGTRFLTKMDGSSFYMDAPDEHGNRNGVSPKRLLLAGLAGCTGIDVTMLLDKMRVAFTDFAIDVQARQTASVPVVYDQFIIRYRIRVQPDDQEKVNRAVQLSKEKYCGVSAMFHHFAEISWEIEWLN